MRTRRAPRRLELIDEAARLRAEDLARSLENVADPDVRALQETAGYAELTHISQSIAGELRLLVERSRR